MPSRKKVAAKQTPAAKKKKTARKKVATRRSGNKGPVTGAQTGARPQAEDQSTEPQIDHRPEPQRQQPAKKTMLSTITIAAGKTVGRVARLADTAVKRVRNRIKPR